MSKYYRTEEMENGGPFKCLSCGALLIAKIKGNCELHLDCKRCKSSIDIKMERPLSKESVENIRGS